LACDLGLYHPKYNTCFEHPKTYESNATRSWEDCMIAFREAAANTRGLVPDTAYTHASGVYSSDVNVFQNAKRIENCGIAKRQNNNRIERMNGTLRERVKVHRGGKTKDTACRGQQDIVQFCQAAYGIRGKDTRVSGRTGAKRMEAIAGASSDKRQIVWKCHITFNEMARDPRYDAIRCGITDGYFQLLLQSSFLFSTAGYA
jgi:hypothetical protein